jgi:hypothetical protein
LKIGIFDNRKSLGAKAAADAARTLGQTYEGVSIQQAVGSRQAANETFASS